MENLRRLTISLVVYRPNILMLSQTLLHLQKAICLLPGFYVELYIIDNSCDAHEVIKVQNCLQQFFSQSSRVRAELIISPKNQGYGQGNNLAIEKINSEYHLVINPDVYVFEDALINAVHYMDLHSKVGLLTPAVFGVNGERHYLCKKHPTLLDMFLRGLAPHAIKRKFAKRMDAFEMQGRDYSQLMEDIEFPTGCFMFFRTSKLKAVKGFDPAFFMYFEDADIARRLAVLAKIVYHPAVKIIHHWARDTYNNRKSKWITTQSGFYYWRKWGGLF
jgi:hypothetical protein